MHGRLTTRQKYPMPVPAEPLKPAIEASFAGSADGRQTRNPDRMQKLFLCMRPCRAFPEVLP
ncbi:hypothetical protein RC1_3438 [Rhodospirillum centenum SW]|uniref:Uncharacterized protein n=1 Tax=Rhodospirillum centenum (strain ATCC 51521 / SW) TaxID=414684 RepID=B6IWX2_RHOCS|nr:hypothetical protein RC1_3438 [Rhodospirillum centenum SW]